MEIENSGGLSAHPIPQAEEPLLTLLSMDPQAHELPPSPPAAPPREPPHVVVFPFPAQGHVNSMLKLAELLMLCLPGDDGLRITFLNSEHNHRHILRCSDVSSRFAGRPTFCFKTISDGLPLEAPRSMDKLLGMLSYLKLKARDVLAELTAPADGQSPATCIIADGILSFVIDVGEEFGVPVVLFRTISACSLWAYFCIPRLIEAEELPIRDMDRLITSAPGMEGLLRCRDLPSLCRVTDLSDPFLQFVTIQTGQSTRARGLILNTFEALEEPVLDQIRAHCPNIYTVGPLHAHLKSQLSAAGQVPTRHSSNSLRKEDRSCLPWLDRQPVGSVLYVSFGSATVLKRDQLTEFWHGIVNSKCRFLWVLRPDSIESHVGIPKDNIDAELQTATEERGCIVEWAPQEEVLAHPAIGGFLTHSGWNSTIESITAGVPMVCWPYFADQQVNSRFVSEAWKVGLDMKDRCNRKVVETMIKDLMVGRRDELSRSAVAKANQAMEAVSEGGSSWDHMNRLTEDIRSMSGPK
ncbi:7-deoxyloganetic acid glucosyl transferase-like [Punica granatum]|uniref:Glycosyltransferase n=2 Tax=Punica granatum TaxID=22663 RepID=A0A2I0IRL3_PUNGR|nr:7-deoxyloganetic acid glucosyl transferase-like [Punica granatum]PKI46624.1 hypothetical protein CRG98_032966 [Punica granatum]